MKRMSKRFLSVIMAVAIVSNYIVCGSTASVQTAAEDNVGNVDINPMERYYWNLLDEYEHSGYTDYTGENISFSLEAVHSSDGMPKFCEYDGVKAVDFEIGCSFLQWQVTVPEDALYNIEVDYYAYNDKSSDIQRELNIDGKLPCMEMSNIRFTRLFCDDGDIRVDVNGDESAPKMKQIFAWQKTRISDYNGYYSDPMKVYLTKGEHTFSLKMRGSQPIAIGGISLTAPESTPNYNEVRKQYTEKGLKPADSDPVIIEGEQTLYRSAASLRLDSSDDLSCYPTDLKNEKINIVGGDAWKNSRQTIYWELDVPKDGLYKLAFNLYNYYHYGLPSYRRIEIDGALPFSEMAEYCFLPDTKWRTEYLMDSKSQPYLFYLESGKHTVSMSIVTGDVTSVIRQLNDDMDILSDLYLDITFVTTSDPDKNYDYQLEERIPQLMDTLKSLHGNLKSSAQLLKTICKNDKALTYSEMQNTLEDFEILMEDVFEIPSNLSQFTTMISQYGNWINQLKAATLSVDKVMLLPSDKEYERIKVPFYKRILSTVAGFLNTFIKDYNSVLGSGIYDKDMKTIDVWYGGTQIWAAEIQDLIESDFVKQNKIQVRFKLTPASQMTTGINAMLLAILSGNAPDAVINAASVEDYMMRNQCYNLKQFDDFDDFAKQFPEVCFVPLTYRGGVYAVPQTIDMNVMFYRTDIFGELGLSVPKTWDDMIKNVIPRLAENNMSLAASPGFEILLYQHGGDLYNDDMTESRIASQISLKAFKMHCDFYTMYGVPKTADFFNRFRTGETPIGFGSIGTYIQFVYAAPELIGRWDIAVLPGVLREDGTVNNSIGGLTTSSAIIMADAKKPKEAWTFIKWYMSTDNQLQLSDRLEAKLDMSARLISANLEAFSSLDWESEHLDVFLETMDETKAYNPVLGNYYTARYIGYAFNNVVVSKTMTERAALEYAQENIDKELERRRNGLS